MKRISALFLLLYFLSTATSFAQDGYHPMAVEGAHWIVVNDRSNTPWFDMMYSFTIRGDSTFNGVNYKKVYLEAFEFNEVTKGHSNKIVSSQLHALIRDDTLEKKVYGINFPSYFGSPEGCPENEEYLLFDFSVEEGDTLNWCGIKSKKLNPQTDSLSFADSIRIAYSYGVELTRRTIYTCFSSTYFGLAVESVQPVIEGIGYEAYGPFINGGSFLMEYCVGNDIKCDFLTSIPQSLLQAQLTIFPNPTTDFLQIESAATDLNDLHQTQLRITDINGRAVQQQTLGAHQNRVDVIDLPQGFYILSIEKGHQIIYSDTFVKH